MANAKVEGLGVTLDDPAGFADRSWWMIGCRCVIYKWNKLRFEPLVLGEQWKQYQKQKILSSTNTIRPNVEDKRLHWNKDQEARGRTSDSRGLRSRGWYKKINSPAIF